MLEAKIHKEITEYEGKIFFGMSGKQVICVLIAVAIVVPLYFILQPLCGVEVTGYICIFAAVPIVAFGFFKYKGHSFTEIIKLMWNFYFINQKKKYINICNVEYVTSEEKLTYEKSKGRNECTEQFTESNKRRKELRNYFATYKKKFVLQPKEK